MFAIFIIIAWSLIMASSAGLTLFNSSGIAFMIMAKNGSTGFENSFIYKLFTKLSKTVGKTLPIYGEKNVLSPSAMNSNINAIYIWMAILSIFAITLFIISIIELVRLRKHQKISKPFVKVIIVMIAIASLLTLQLIMIIVASLIFVSFILLEIVLFDSEALNNYAEERNLISIYKEERKFEKEVSKEGKLIGNVDLKNQQKDFQKNLDQNEANDNSALPNINEKQLEDLYKEGKAKKYYLKWKENIQKLEEQKKDIENNLNNLNENEKNKIINKYNINVMKVNSLAKKLKIPESYYVEYMVMDEQKINTLKDQEKLNEENIISANFRTSSIGEATNAFGGEISNAIDEDLENLHERYSGSNKPGVPQTFIPPQTKTQDTRPKGYDEELMMRELAKAVNMDLSQLPTTNEPANADKTIVYSDFNFEQKDYAMEIMAEALKKSNANKGSINTIPGTTITVPPSFDLTMNSNVEENQSPNSFSQPIVDQPNQNVANASNHIQEEQVNDFVPSTPQTFIPPQTKTQDTRPKGYDEELMMRELAKAVNMDLSQLPTTNEPANADKTIVYSDFNFEQKDYAMEIMAEALKKSNANKGSINTIPGTTITVPPSFDLTMNSNVEEKIEDKNIMISEEMSYENEYGLEGSNQPPFTKTFEQPIQGFEQPTQKIQPIQGFEQPTQKIQPIQGFEQPQNIQMQSNNINENLNNKEIIHREIKTIDLEKLNSIEARMSKLESLIESLGNKFKGDQLAQDFNKISSQLDSISKVVNELEHNTPRTIIDSLTSKHGYNKK